jgi:hypothetical protein
MELYNSKLNAIIKIQSWFRGCILRLKRLPLIMYKIKQHLLLSSIIFTRQCEDGRTNSYIDEDKIINILIEKFGNRIKRANMRMWYDILAYDYLYGWIPINIKTTTTLTSDNTGNMAMCVYAYTNTYIDIHKNTTYDNGDMSKILLTNLKEKKYNRSKKKDYYFLVLNKSDNKDIIINSVKGLKTLTPNLNNLPFQICWNKNREYLHNNINDIVNTFIKCLKKPKPSWKEIFMENIRTLE